MKRIVAALILALFALISCATPQETPASLPAVAVTATETATATATITATERPTITPRPTRTPSPTIPATTLTAVAALDAIRINLLNQHPDLEKYGAICNISYCIGILTSPNGNNIIITNVNVMEVFNADGQRVGVYPYYDLYGYQFDNMNGFVSPFHWSKDGRYLFIAAKGAGDGGPTLGLDYEGTLIRVNLKNGTWEDTGISGTMSFSPTDQYIAYSAANNSEIRIMDLKSGTETKFFVTDYYRYFSKFVWSPSGRKIIVAALPEDWFEAIFPEARIKTEGIVSGLYVIDLDLKTIYKVHESAYPFYYPVCWSEDNKITLDRMNEHGEWTLDLSTNPPTITP